MMGTDHRNRCRDLDVADLFDLFVLFECDPTIQTAHIVWFEEIHFLGHTPRSRWSDDNMIR